MTGHRAAVAGSACDLERVAGPCGPNGCADDGAARGGACAAQRGWRAPALVGWGMFRSMLTSKADRNATHLVTIGRFFPSSKTCGACGLINADLTLADRVWTCACRVQHDRDLNVEIARYRAPGRGVPARVDRSPHAHPRELDPFPTPGAGCAVADAVALVTPRASAVQRTTRPWYRIRDTQGHIP